ncbi:MAG TPA: thermonuclease family protein [bacterium]|nr:thermonuclease family protein [bacterium]
MITEPGVRPARFPAVRAAWLAAALAAALLGLGLQCTTFFPLLETKGFKVSKITGPETIEVEMKAQDSYGPAEYQVIRLQGFEAARDEETVAELTKTLADMLLNKRVHLEYDQPGHPWGAGWGELLAYVHLNDKLVNAELIRRGLGRFSMNWNPIRHAAEMQKAESEARDAKRGLWGRIKEYVPPRPQTRDDDYDRGRDRGYDDSGDDRDDGGREVNIYRREYERDH